MSLSRVQRDAMVSAQRGQWDLADALEVSRRDPINGLPCIGGIRQGGRLQMLAFGRACNCALDNDCDCFEPGDAGIDLIVGLNGRLVWENQDGNTAAPFHIDLTLGQARATLAGYDKTVANPTQQILIPEAA